jgi:hypothetical protein
VLTCVTVGPAGPKPWELVPQISCPILVAWGDTDPFTPLDGPVGQFFVKQAVGRPNIEVQAAGQLGKPSGMVACKAVFGCQGQSLCQRGERRSAVKVLTCNKPAHLLVSHHFV